METTAENQTSQTRGCISRLLCCLVIMKLRQAGREPSDWIKGHSEGRHQPSDAAVTTMSTLIFFSVCRAALPSPGSQMDTAAGIRNTSLVTSREHRGTSAHSAHFCLPVSWVLYPNLSHMTSHLNSTGQVGITVLHEKCVLGGGGCCRAK